MALSLRLQTLLLAAAALASASPHPTFRISFPEARSTEPLTGRLLLVLSTDGGAEPRMQIDDTPRSQMLFGIDVENWQPGKDAVVDANAFGYPVRSLGSVPPGDYYVQAVLHLYETFHRADGKTVKLPMDRGEGQHWNLAPGNLYSKPLKITLGNKALRISLDQVIPPIPQLKDTKYIRHVRIQSQLLSQFWGRPMYLGAHILVPEGFDEHPEAHYPVAIFHGHFPA